MSHYVYVAKSDEVLNFCSGSDWTDIKIKKDRSSKINSTHVYELNNDFVALPNDACVELKTALESNEEKNIVDKLTRFVDTFDKYRNEDNEDNNEKVVIHDDDVIFLIHFGQMGKDTSRSFTKAMYDVVKKGGDDVLKKHIFIAVSRHFRYPSIFFKDGTPFFPPYSNDEIREILENWIDDAKEIPAYDHLRGISILCQALLQLDDAERKEKLDAAKWWRDCLWHDKIPATLEAAFSRPELRLIRGDCNLHDFCNALVESPKSLSGYNDEKLMKIVKNITNALNTKGGKE